MHKRPRRNRRTPAIRSLVEETLLRPSDLVMPFFVLPGEGQKQEIAGMPGIFKLSLDFVLKEAERLHRKGIPAICLFPAMESDHKDAVGTAALRENSTICSSLQKLKKELPSLCLISDIALDPYTSHGHDGLVGPDGTVLNDPTIEILAQMALLHAQAGADFVAPSDMMDGRVAAIRKKLDGHDLSQVGIISYTAKYVSSLYKPFRGALGSTPAFGDKKGYQLNPANVREALLEASLDEDEGADVLMVKPALFYLDIIAKMRAQTHLPICAYHVSGEYAMVMAAHEKGYVDAPKTFFESLTCIKRAGADFIFTYAAPMMLDEELVKN